MAKQKKAALQTANTPLKAEKNSAPEPVGDPWGEDDARFWQVALVLLLVGIALRQIALARAPYSSDEAIHAWFSLGFEGYNYDPIYHGPLLYHLLATAFAIIKPYAAGDFVGRMVPSLLGIALLAVTVGPARRWLGPKGALWSLALLAISPVMVAYHRFLIHDALTMLLTLGAVLCFQRTLETHSWTQSGRQARVGLAALLTLFLATKANAFFIIAMLFAFWIMVLLVRKCGTANEERVLPKQLAAWLPIALFGLIAVASHFALRDDDFKTYIDNLQKAGLGNFPLTLAKLTHSEGTFKFISVFCVSLLGLWLLFAPRAAEPEAPTADEVAARPKFDLRTPVLAGWVTVFLLAYLYGHGVFWWKVPAEIARNPDVWSQKFSASVGAIKAAALHQYQFAPAPDGDWTKPQLAEAPDWDSATMAIPRMLHYWGGQQAKPRLPGPHDYYLVLMILYELPIALAAIGGIVHAAKKRTPFGDLLLWWAFTSFVLYALANEKVPWLLTQIMLPLILLAGVWLGSLEVKTERRGVFYAACALSALFLLRNVAATSFGRPVDQHEPLYYAQTTETFRDEYAKALDETAQQSGDVWVDFAVQWPVVWWLRQGAPLKGDSNMALSASPPTNPMRVAVTSVETWDKYKSQLKDWNAKKVDYFIWPRASWPAIRPDRFWNFWAHRRVNPEYKQPGYRDWKPDGTLNDDSLLAWPGEWSHGEIIVATHKG